jgi:hypothetical protein
VETKINQIKNYFYSGLNAKVIECWQSDTSLEKVCLAEIIGALSLSGDIYQALDIYQGYRVEAKDIENSLNIECRFYLAIGMIRISKYTEARRYIYQNLAAIKSTQSAASLFFIYQGIGFYRFICGRYKSAYSKAKKAYYFAHQINFYFGQLLSTDLLGHCEIRRGEISSGLKNLRDAKEKAFALGSTGIEKSVDIAIAITNAKYKMKAAKAVRLLNKSKTLEFANDNYSKSSLLLELAEVHTNMGQCKKARSCLDQASQFIYETKNRRHEILLNLKLSQLQILSGSYTEALASLQLCFRLADPIVDKPLLLEILSNELQILSTLQTEKHRSESARISFNNILELTGDYKNLRIYNRVHPNGFVKWKSEEDLIGDLMDISDTRKAIHEVIDSGYLGLLRKHLKINDFRPCLYLDLTPKAFTIFYQGEVDHQPEMLTETLRKLILIFESGQKSRISFSKEDLVQKIWQYEYNPLLHDSLIHATLNRFRNLLGDYRDFLLLTEEGYSLRSDIDIRAMHAKHSKDREHGIGSSSSAPSKLTFPVAQSAKANFLQGPFSLKLPGNQILVDDLNHRQIQILQFLDKNTFVDIQICQELFQVSPITASRDLSDLFKRSFISRLGKARATKYTLALFNTQNTNRVG